MSFLPPLPVIIPFISAAFFLAVAPFIKRKVTDFAAIIISGAVFVLTLIIYFHAPIVYWFGGWQIRGEVALGISFVIDKTGALFAILASLLTMLALIYSWKYFDEVENLYHSLIFIFLGAMNGFSYTGDLFNMFVFFELMSVTAYALTGYKNESSSPLQGSLNFAVTNTIGGFLILTGIAFVYSRTGALNLAQAGSVISTEHLDGLITISFILITTGYFIKAALVPFHFWLADAHAVAPTPVSVLFSGIMAPLGIYGFARVYIVIFSGALGEFKNVFMGILIGIGILTIVIGSIMCFTERSLKRMLAFSTISNMGIVLIGIASLDSKAFAGSILYILSHGLLKSALFMCTGILLHRFGSVDEIDLKGKGKDIPYIGFLFFISAIALSGLPPFGIFISKTFIDESFKFYGISWLTLVFLFESFISGGALIRAAGRIFLNMGPRTEKLSNVESKGEEEEEETTKGKTFTPVVMIIPIITLVIAAASLGVYPAFLDSVSKASKEFLNQKWYESLVFNKNVPSVLSNISIHISSGYLIAFISSAGALAVALLSLLRKNIPEKISYASEKIFIPPIAKLKSFQSGLVGDYVTWIIFGTTIMGGIYFLVYEGIIK
jgi:multicomponent Na+:H+ antiporter subunit D